MGGSPPPHLPAGRRLIGRRAAWLALWAGLVASAWPALAPGDVAYADHLWTAAVAADVPPDSPVWIEVARGQRAVAPWQAGWARCRARGRAVGELRRTAVR